MRLPTKNIFIRFYILLAFAWTFWHLIFRLSCSQTYNFAIALLKTMQHMLFEFELKDSVAGTLKNNFN